MLTSFWSDDHQHQSDPLVSNVTIIRQTVAEIFPPTATDPMTFPSLKLCC